MGHLFSTCSSKENRKMSSKSNLVIVSASAKHTATLIFLHGLGDTGHGWASTLADVRPPHVKIVCPTASTMPVTLNSGFRMPAWFDLMTLDSSGPEDAPGIKKSAKIIEGLIEEEVSNGIDVSRIVVGGFSQGGALALYVGLTSKFKVGGILGLSCWLPLHREIPSQNLGSRESLPCLQMHGDCDPVVPYRWGQLTSTTLKGFLKEHEFKTYKGLMHSSSPEELVDIQNFLKKVLPS